ncbi:MAG: hypothetical protein ACI8QT_000003 [Halioglobus sp.]|jgi:hypothetical protein
MEKIMSAKKTENKNNQKTFSSTHVSIRGDGKATLNLSEARKDPEFKTSINNLIKSRAKLLG